MTDTIDLSDLPPHIAAAIVKARAIGERREQEKAERHVQSVESNRVRARERKRRIAAETRGKREELKMKRKRQREEEHAEKVKINLAQIGVDRDDFQGADLAAESIASLVESSVSGKKTSTCDTSSSSAPDTDQSSNSKKGCYLALPEYDKDYFCGWCNCGKIAPWHYQLVPVSLVPFELLKNFANDDNSNYENVSDGDTDGESKASPVTVASTPFKTAADTRKSSRPAVVTPPEKTSAKPNPTVSVKIARKERGIDYVTRQADKIVAEQFSSDDLRAAVFGQKISRPLGDRKRPGKIALSWYPPKYLPVFGDGSGMKRMRKEDIVGHSNHIIHVGKSIMKQSEWNVDEAEADVFGSSTKYHTLLVHDPNIAATEKAGLSIIYFKPVAKYFWLSFITTASNARRAKKEDPGRGYGRMILWRLINLARNADGIEEIYLEVNPEWTTAIDLYRSFHFEEISWDMLPKEIEAFEFKIKANDNPECKKMDYESLFKHHGEYTLMRLNTH